MKWWWSPIATESVSLVSFKLERDRAVIRAHDLREVVGSLHLGECILADKEIVNSPSDIFLSTLPAVGPPGVVIRLPWVKVAKGID